MNIINTSRNAVLSATTTKVYTAMGIPIGHVETDMLKYLATCHLIRCFYMHDDEPRGSVEWVTYFSMPETISKDATIFDLGQPRPLSYEELFLFWEKIKNHRQIIDKRGQPRKHTTPLEGGSEGRNCYIIFDEILEPGTEDDKEKYLVSNVELISSAKAGCYPHYESCEIPIYVNYWVENAGMPKENYVIREIKE